MQQHFMRHWTQHRVINNVASCVHSCVHSCRCSVIVLRKSCTCATRENSGADTRCNFEDACDGASCVSTCDFVEYCAVVNMYSLGKHSLLRKYNRAY